MKIKRTPQRPIDEIPKPSKRSKGVHDKDYFEIALDESGLQLKEPPEKCIASHETVTIIRNLKKNLLKHLDYPRNVSEFFESFKKRCDESIYLKHYLFPNIVRITSDNCTEYCINESLIRILLNIPILQNNLIDFIFEKAIDLAADSKCGPWIQMFLKCFSSLDNLADSEKISVHLINLLDVTSEKMVRLEIITAIPDIIGDQSHDNIANEMSRILSEDQDLMPAILDCLSYLCLSDEQYAQLQKKVLNILMTLTKCSHFPSFVKFLLMPRRTGDNAYLEAVQGLRNALGWSTSMATLQDIASSQILTASAIRNSMVSSKIISNAWLKVISNCQLNTDHKPIDFVIILILHSTTEEKQKQLENVIKKQVKSNIFNEELLNEAFDKFKPIMKNYLKNLIYLTNSLLKSRGDTEVQHIASHIYGLMFSKLEDCCQTVVAELLQLGLDSKHCVMNILLILNNIASKDISLLKPQSNQMLTLLDRMDNMALAEIRAVMNLLCGLAYSYENSVIRNDIQTIIGKELGSSNPVVKVQGIIAGVNAVKYLMASKDEEDHSLETSDDSNIHNINHLPRGDLREAAEIIELISCSTRQFPDMIALYYDELYKVVQSSSYINTHFLNWITDAVTNDLQQNFIVDTIENRTIEDVKLDMQFCLNTDSEMDETIAINIAGLTLNDKQDVSIIILSPLFQLVQALHMKKYNGNLSSIDALLGCPVIMPVFDIDFIENMSNASISYVLDCKVHCVNWFRELLNAFASQNDPALKPKTLNRVLNVQKLEKSIEEILLQSNIVYRPPAAIYNVNTSNACFVEKKNARALNTKSRLQKKTHDAIELSATIKSQASIKNTNNIKNKVCNVQNIVFRPLSLKLVHLLQIDLSETNNQEKNLTIETLTFILQNINRNLENILLSKIKKNTFLTKQDDSKVYDRKKAEECAQYINEMLPKIMDHMKAITIYLDENVFSENEGDFLAVMYTGNTSDYLSGLENILILCTTYFKWIGFKNNQKALFKTSLRIIASIDGENSNSLQDILLSVAKYLQKHEKYCIYLTTAMPLFEFFKTIQEFSSNKTIKQIIKDMAKKFLSNQWKTPDGTVEKGLYFNQCLDNFAEIYFMNNQLLELKNSTLLIINDIQDMVDNRNSTLNSFQSVNKGSFPILYRNIGNALLSETKIHVDKRLTNAEHLELWKNVVFILKCMMEIAKMLNTRNNLAVFFKKSLPIIKIFVSHGIPILELEFKSKTKEILELLKSLQQCTRFLHSLCCHSKLKKVTTLINKVPYVRQLLESLLYKVKAVLAANNCSQAFWMGNLKNKDINGKVISTQESDRNEETAEDCDDQLPEDDDSDGSDDELLDPASGTASDIV